MWLQPFTEAKNMTNQPNAPWSFRVSDRIQVELDEFQKVVAQFKAGAMTEGQFRIIRVPAGVYEQRENGTYMLRVRFPAGGVTAAHLRRLGEVSATFGNGLLHVLHAGFGRQLHIGLESHGD